MSHGPFRSRSLDVNEEVALAVNQQLTLRKRTADKSSLSKAKPLKLPLARGAGSGSGGSGGRTPGISRTFRQAWKQTAGDLSEEEQRKAVQQALEVFRQLPASSTYAQHRIRTLEKALQLLDSARSASEQEELQLLLARLRL